MKAYLSLIMVLFLGSALAQTAKTPEEKAAQRQKWVEEMEANTRKKRESESVDVLAEIRDPKNRWMKPLWEDYYARYVEMTDLGRIRREEALLAARVVALNLMEGKTLPKEVLAWSKMAIKKTIETGMPAEFILLSWGEPAKKETSSDGSAIWFYKGNGAKRHRLILIDGLLDQWTRFNS
ncbi:MAG: hypothetical protein V4675_03315 [Verrucomicrobiota bacterium]